MWRGNKMFICTWADMEVDMSEIIVEMDKIIKKYPKYSLTYNDFRIDVETEHGGYAEIDLVCPALSNAS
jgi:hypothetical protein